MSDIKSLYDGFVQVAEKNIFVDLNCLDKLCREYLPIIYVEAGYKTRSGDFKMIRYTPEFGAGPTTPRKLYDYEVDYLRQKLDKANDLNLEEIYDTTNYVWGKFLRNEVVYFIQIVVDESCIDSKEAIILLEILKANVLDNLNDLYIDEMAKKVESYELRDSLTTLNNRIVFRRDIDERLASGLPFSLIRLKLVSLHKINTVFGNQTGDELLKKFSEKLISINGAQAYRTDGSEFMLVCDVDKCDAVKEYVSKILNDPLLCGNTFLRIESFLGCVDVYEESAKFSDVVFRSEIALADGRLRGVNKFGEFRDELCDSRLEETRIAEALPKAISRKNFELHYQAQICARTKGVVGLEALLRWNLDGKFVSPGKFIPIAEKNGYILDIGYLVVEEACKYQRYLSDLGVDICISINVSARQLLDAEFPKKVSDIVNEVGADVTKMAIEITESTDIGGTDILIEYKLIELRELGFKIHMDDFGTGYSSLGYLRKGMFDTLKIDREFIKTIGTPDEKDVDRMLITSMIDMARGVGMEVVVEGVETGEQVSFLETTKCDIIQGFVFSKPTDGYSMIDYLSNRGVLNG